MIGVALAFAKGAWGFLRAIPWQAWAVAALVAAAWWYGERRYDAGETAERGRWEAAQVEADRKASAEQRRRDRAAEDVNSSATQRGHEAAVETRTETAAAAEKVRYVTRTIQVPADCPTGLPPVVRDEGRAAVERARAAGDPLRASGNP